MEQSVRSYDQVPSQKINKFSRNKSAFGKTQTQKQFCWKPNEGKKCMK